MSDILNIITEDLQLTISSNSIEKKQNIFFQTYYKRKKINDKYAQVNFNDFSSEIICKAQEDITAYLIDFSGERELLLNTGNTSLTNVIHKQYSLSKPIFFDNSLYAFEIFFTTEVTDAFITHPHQKLVEKFKFTKSSQIIPSHLVGEINTSNDLGTMNIVILYYSKGNLKKFELTFEILSTKMMVKSDLRSMYNLIDESFPFLRYELEEKTEQYVSKTSFRSSSDIFWYANFKHLKHRFSLGLKQIRLNPFKQLHIQKNRVRIDKIKKTPSNKNLLKMKNDISNGYIDKKYRVASRVSSFDTPENRFIKFIVITCIAKLSTIINTLNTIQQQEIKEFYSKSFLEGLVIWKKDLESFTRAEFINQIPVKFNDDFSAQVLQNKNGYRSVYNIWLQLKNHLSSLSEIVPISTKSVSKTYEIWCLLIIRDILLKDLEFEHMPPQQAWEQPEKSSIMHNTSSKISFEFYRCDGIIIELLHEPLFNKYTKLAKSLTVPQKPDIVLNIYYSNGKIVTFIFDAKYRVENISSTGNDMVPEDAINQLHRYRDAIVLDKDNSLYRAVTGAFALYPGNYDQDTSCNPYNESISKVGIGAFALLPLNNKKHGQAWLTDFIKKEVGVLY